MAQRFAHAIGFDDAPFPREHRGDVLVVGAVFAYDHLDGVLSTRVRRDGANATDRLIACLLGSRFHAQLQLVLLQGITMAGFNVVDIQRLHAATGLPVLVATRRAPDLEAIHRTLVEKVPAGARKWRLIQAAGDMEATGGIFVQHAGIGADEAAALVARWQLNGRMLEPLRAAHLIAGGIASGESRHRV
jgi:uncharacterized protein